MTNKAPMPEPDDAPKPMSDDAPKPQPEATERTRWRVNLTDKDLESLTGAADKAAKSFRVQLRRSLNPTFGSDSKWLAYFPTIPGPVKDDPVLKEIVNRPVSNAAEAQERAADATERLAELTVQMVDAMNATLQLQQTAMVESRRAQRFNRTAVVLSLLIAALSLFVSCQSAIADRVEPTPAVTTTQSPIPSPVVTPLLPTPIP